MSEDPSRSSPWPVIVVSLEALPERRASIRRQFEGRGHDWRFADAIDGRNGLAAEYEPLLDRPGARRRLGRPMSDGEFACALSHLEVYREIVESGFPGAIVLEDDAILTPGFDAFMAQRAYLSAPLILMFHFIARVRLHRRPRQFGGFCTYPVACNPVCGTAYSISRAAAEAMLATAYPVRCVADWPSDISRLGATVTLPLLVEAGRPEESTLGAERARLEEAYPALRGLRRYIRPAYWNRWWIKRTTWRVS